MNKLSPAKLDNVPMMKYLPRISAALALSLLSACATMTPQTDMPAAGQDIPANWLLKLPEDGGNIANWSAIYDDAILLDYLRE